MTWDEWKWVLTRLWYLGVGFGIALILLHTGILHDLPR